MAKKKASKKKPQLRTDDHLIKKYEQLKKEHSFIGKIKKKLSRNKDLHKKRKQLQRSMKGKKDKALDEEEEKEKKLDLRYYWSRALTGVVTGILGVYPFHLVGWWMFLYFMLFLFVFPFIIALFIMHIPYDKEKWNWKRIIKRGISAQFFLFLLVSTIAFTYAEMDIYGERFENPADTHEIAVDGSMLYVADGKDGLLILNISLPHGHRDLIGSVKLNGSVMSVGLYSDESTSSGQNSLICIIMNSETGLLFYNVSIPSNPELIYENSSIISESKSNIDVYGDLLFISYDQSIIIMNVSNPANPDYVSEISFDGNEKIESIYKEGNSLYVMDGADGIVIVDLSDPYIPQVVDSFGKSALGLNASHMIISENKAFVTYDHYGLMIYDLSDTNNITLIQAINITNWQETPYFDCGPVVEYNKTVYFSAGIYGIWMYNESAGNASLVYNSLGTGESVTLSNQFLLISDGWRGIDFIDLNNPKSSPPPLSTNVKKISLGWMWAPLAILSVALLVVLNKKKARYSIN